MAILVILSPHIPGSSNGRTTDSESVYRGSNPCPGTKKIATLVVIFCGGQGFEWEDGKKREFLTCGGKLTKTRRLSWERSDVRLPVPEPLK